MFLSEFVDVYIPMYNHHIITLDFKRDCMITHCVCKLINLVFNNEMTNLRCKMHFSVLKAISFSTNRLIFISYSRSVRTLNSTLTEVKTDLTILLVSGPSFRSGLEIVDANRKFL